METFKGQIAWRLREWRRLLVDDEHLVMGAFAWLTILLAPLFIAVLLWASWRGMRWERKHRRHKPSPRKAA